MATKANQYSETLTGLLEASAAAAPETPALIYGGTSLSFAGLAAQARRAAGGLASLGVKPGDRVARNNFLSGLKVRDEGARTC